MNDDTITAIATPPGESGLGVIRVSGPAALDIAKSIFQPAKPVDLATVPGYTCHFGTLITPSPGLRPPSPYVGRGAGGEGEAIDQVVLTVFRAPNSYTGEDVVEISAHGSPFILNQVLQACVKQGARVAEPGEFTQRAFLAGKMDLTQAEAVADLIRARTDQSHAAALAQLEGHLAGKVRSLRDSLLPLLAHVEVGLDHSDEDHDFLSRGKLVEKCAAVQEEIEALLASARVGKILREGLRVALVGRPNVGKSSLLNALLKEERAIVTPVPGTTRDTLEEALDWDGIPVVLTDTAGVRAETRDPIERLGIERTRKALQGADVVLCMFDASEPLSEEDYALMRECESKPHIWVMNKSDLTPSLTPTPSPYRRGEKAKATYPLPLGEGGPPKAVGEADVATLEQVHEVNVPFVRVSAKTGQGLTELVRAVKDLSLGGKSPAGEARWMINARHEAALQRAHGALQEAAAAARKDAYEECVALELHAALQALGEIIGETATEDLLDEIFSNFCIGK